MSTAILKYSEYPLSAFPCEGAPAGANRMPARGDRERIEDFIRAAYRKVYGAAIDIAYPALISACQDDGDIRAAAGFRYADSGPLFLEQYTRMPAEAVMSRFIGRPVARERIAEIGNLASLDGSASLFLFKALASRLRESGVTHVMVTVTDALHRRFLRFGLHPYVVCDAREDLLGEHYEDWGSYYETRPRVLAGTLDEALMRLQALPGVIRESGRPLTIRVCNGVADE